MCGIAGILDLDPASAPPDEAQLRRMLGSIRHRGPDQFGIYLDDGVGLGNARLSIIDLDGGQQPISNEDQSLWIVYNGEVFNYLELRDELEAKGHRFRTRTDTEVVLHLFEEYGPGCLEKLNGQWALAIWDQRRRSLLLARDRLGVRPIFFTRANGRLVFGSEIKAILTLPEISREIDAVGLDQVFTLWSAQAPNTCFRGIEELPAGCFLRADAEKVVVERYWRMDFHAEEWPSDGPSLAGDGTEDRGATGDPERAKQLRELLTDAVRVRLRADVPVGAYLSGGLDSSVIAALVREIGTSHLDTFSIAFSDPQFDESEHQRKMAQFLGTDHHVVYATHEEIGAVFPDVVWHAESALMRTAPAPMLLLSRLVRQRGYKVVLTGEASDELLAGYNIFKEAKVRRFWAREPASESRPLLFQRLYPDIAGLQSAGGAYLKSFFGTGLTDTDDPFYSHAIRWRNNARCKRFFSEEVKDQLSGRAAQEFHPYFSGDPPDTCKVPPAFRSWGALEKAQYLEINTFLSTYLLSSQGDRMGMANSVEGRFPFLDPRVVEFASRLPSRSKLHVLRDKALLRTMARELIPDEILGRPKRPYRAPIQRSFLNAASRDWVDELLSEAGLRRSGLFRPEAVMRLVTKADRGRPLGETDSMALVGVISGQLLHRRFVESFEPGAPLGPGDDVKVVVRGEIRVDG